MKLLHDYVLVKKSEEEQTVGGIILSTVAQKIGEVVATGEGTFSYGKWIHNDVEVGDTVQYDGGSTIKIEGKEYLLLRNSDIICILNKE